MPEYVTFITTAPGAGSGSGNRLTSRCPGAVITAARTVPLTRLERYRISVELPAMVGVGRDQPAARGTGHHVQIVEVVTRTCGHGVVATRDQDDIAVADLDRFVHGAVIRVDELHGEALGSREPVVLRLLDVGLARRGVRAVLVRRAGRAACP